MSSQSQIDRLTDSTLDMISGGMECRTSIAISNGYLSLARVFVSMGDTASGAFYAGKAMGIMEGACPK